MLNERILLVVIALLAATPAQADNWDEVRERGFLRVAVYRDYQPFSYKDGGRTRGVDVELGQAIAEKLGLTVAIMLFTADENVEDDLRNMVWKGHYLGTGTADVMLHVPVDSVLEDDKVKIFAPYYRAELAVVYDPEQMRNADRLEVFDNYTVGVETDSLADHYLTSFYGGRYRENVRHFMTASEAAAALKARQIAAFMGPLTHIQGALGEAAGDYGVSRPPLRGLAATGWNVGLAVKADNLELIRRLDAAVQALREDGSVAQLFRNYRLSYAPPR